MTRFLACLLLPLTLLTGGAHAATLALTVGQTGQLGRATVTLLRAQDSRCPMNARCIQAGELRATVLVVQGRRARLVHLTLPGTAAGQGLHISGANSRVAGPRPEPLQVTFSDGR